MDKALDSMDVNQTGAKYISKTEYVRDQITLPLGSELVETHIFQSKQGMPISYKTNDFPSTATGFKVHGIKMEIDSNLSTSAGAPTTDAQAMALYRHAVNHSSLKVMINDTMVIRIPAAEMVPFKFKPNPTITAGEVPWTIESKFSDIYMLPEPIIVSPGSTVEFIFEPAKGLVASAADATKKGETFVPGLNISGDKAYVIRFELESEKLMRNKNVPDNIAG